MDEIGVLYSATSGVILRIIDPDGNYGHLDWLEDHKPEGTILYRCLKNEIMPNGNIPNMERIIKFVKEKHNLDLREGIQHAVIDKQKNEVVENVICCPDLYQKRLDKIKKKDSNKDYYLVESKSGFKGQKYDPVLKKFKTKTKNNTWVNVDEWIPNQ